MSGDTGAPSDLNPVAGYFADWFNRVSRIQAEQPHWVTPLVTVTPRLEEEIRYDQFWQSIPGGHQLDNYDGDMKRRAGTDPVPERLSVIKSAAHCQLTTKCKFTRCSGKGWY